jgi:hypothetical protein
MNKVTSDRQFGLFSTALALALGNGRYHTQVGI